MKLVKLGIFALSMGLFVASCGDSTNNEETTIDSMSTEVIAPVPMDTTTAMPADTTTMSITTDTTTVVH